MMTRLFHFSLLFSLVIWNTSCERQVPETLVTGGYDETEMDAAMEKARANVDVFLEALESKQGGNFSVKAGVTDGESVEHFWLTDLTFDGTMFTGLIGNDPGLVSNVKFGDEYKIAKEKISDWMFMRDEKIHGNYTMRPLLKTMSKEEADHWRSMLAEP